MVYNCDQYKVSSDKSKSLIWLTTELGSGFSNFSKSLMLVLSNGRGRMQGTTIPYAQDANGVMMKVEVTDLSTKSNQAGSYRSE